MGGYAWVTLATNDSYSLGALVLAHSLKQAVTAHRLAVLVTPGVTNSMRQKLAGVFDLVEEVNVLDSKDEANLRLLKRPELGITFTKLHCWRLTQFEKCVFLDADTLVLKNADELFERDEFSAAPDVGWPDCFNSGVFVYHPSNETYEKLVEFALAKGSFDGGDQGLLNLYFSDWAHKDINKHLPFIYNMCSTACYSYLPAFKQFGSDVKIVHFIGATKPWLQYFNSETKQVQPGSDMQHLNVVLQSWWDIFCKLVHSNLSTDMNDQPTNAHYLIADSTFYQPSDYRDVWDPWEDYVVNNDAISSTQLTNNTDNQFESHNTNSLIGHMSDNIPAPSPIPRSQPLESIQSSQELEIVVPPPVSQSQASPVSNIQSVDANITNIYSNVTVTTIDSSCSHEPDEPIYIQVPSSNKDTVVEVLEETTSIDNDPFLPLLEIVNSADVIEDCTTNDEDNDGGLAGAFAQFSLGSPRPEGQNELEDHLRRQSWEVGNIDYMGRDAFDKIWSKISETIATVPESGSKEAETTACTTPEAISPAPQKTEEAPVKATQEEVKGTISVTAEEKAVIETKTIDTEAPKIEDVIKASETKATETKPDEATSIDSIIVTSEGPKTGALKPDERKSEAPKAEEVKSETPKVECDVPTSEAPKAEELKSEVTKADDVKPETIKTEELKPSEPLKVEEVKPEVPKVEDVKHEAPKLEDVKGDVHATEVPKTEEIKTELAKAEEMKPETTKSEEIKTSEPPKAEEVKPEVPKVEDLKLEAPKDEEVKPVSPKVEEVKPEIPKVEDVKPKASEVEVKQETPKVEEVKPEAQKVEEIKQETPKVEEVKSEAPKVEELKTETPKVEEVKSETSKVEELKPETPKVEEVKSEAPKVEELKPETPKVEEVKSETPKLEELKPETPKVEEVKSDAPKAEVRTDVPKEEVKIDASKLEEVKADAPKATEALPEVPKELKPETHKVEEVKSEAPKVEEVKPETPKVEEVKSVAHKVEDVKPDAPKVEDAKLETPKVEEVKTETPKPGELKIDDAKIEVGAKPKQVIAELPKFEKTKTTEEQKLPEPQVPVESPPVDIQPKVAEKPLETVVESKTEEPKQETLVPSGTKESEKTAESKTCDKPQKSTPKVCKKSKCAKGTCPAKESQSKKEAAPVQESSAVKTAECPKEEGLKQETSLPITESFKSSEASAKEDSKKQEGTCAKPECAAGECAKPSEEVPTEAVKPVTEKIKATEPKQEVPKQEESKQKVVEPKTETAQTGKKDTHKIDTSGSSPAQTDVAVPSTPGITEPTPPTSPSSAEIKEGAGLDVKTVVSETPPPAGTGAVSAPVPPPRKTPGAKKPKGKK